MESFLFHSFPRPGSGAVDLDAGLKTLEGFLRIGFVLAPEIVESTEQLSNSNKGRKLQLGQKRLCFTALDEKYLKHHSITFGPFSIQFPLQKLQIAGAVPVFYFPPNEIENGVGGISASLLIQALGDGGNLLKELADLGDFIANKSVDDVLNFSWGDEKKFSAEISVSHFSIIIAYLNHKHGNIRSIHNAVRGLGQLFYPTQGAGRDPLGYYHQREWRIIGDISVDGKPLCRPLNKKEKDLLLRLNRRFFEREITLLTGKKKRVDECRTYQPLNVSHPMELATRIISPKEKIESVKNLLKKHKFSLNVVALEDFPDEPPPL